MSGYAQKQCGVLNTDDSCLYYEEYGAYFKSLNRGKLEIRFDFMVQFTLFSYFYFTKFYKLTFSHKFLGDKFMFISEQYHLNATKKHCKVLTNIYFKNFVHLKTLKSTREASMKLAKLC